MTNHETMLATAVHYVYQLGLSVIPMSRESKKPLIKWKEYQLRRPTFTEIAEWPDCNLAIITGAVSGIVVVDCESRENAEWFYRERAKSGTVVKTRRGFHLYFKHPAQTVQNAIKVEDRYDVRGDGGYVLAPPSSHSEGEYEWVLPFTRELPTFDPAWRPNTVANGLEREITDGVKYIAQIRAVSGSGGHNDTYRAACVLRSSGMGEADALLALQEWNRTNADPPWTDRELLHKIHDAYR